MAGAVTGRPQRTDPYVLGNELLYSLGVGVDLVPERLELVFEGYGAAPLISGAERATPLEALVAIRIFLLGNSFLTVGATRGFLDSYGDPDVRAFGGIIFETKIGDRDGDGINDDIDQCPNNPEDKDGYLDDDGCPDVDNDLDGVVDSKDDCKMTPEDPDGYEDTDGCPEDDNDGDEVVDVEDQCPLIPGVKSGDKPGCPKKKPALVVVTKKEIKITQQIHFAFGKSTIRPVSFRVLDAVADVLRDNPKIKLEVQGHTDNKGSPSFNKALSDSRAKAVRRYLVDKGIDSGRLRGKGYGMDRPLVPNTSARNRALNRRVQFVRTEKN